MTEAAIDAPAAIVQPQAQKRAAPIVPERSVAGRTLVLLIGIVLTLVSLGALATLDATDGRGHRRIFPARWWRLHPRDYVVIGALLVLVTCTVCAVESTFTPTSPLTKACCVAE